MVKILEEILIILLCLFVLLLKFSFKMSSRFLVLTEKRSRSAFAWSHPRVNQHHRLILRQFGNRCRRVVFPSRRYCRLLFIRAPVSCRRISVEKKQAKHQNYGHPRLMAASQRCAFRIDSAACTSRRPMNKISSTF